MHLHFFVKMFSFVLFQIDMTYFLLITTSLPLPYLLLLLQ